MKAILGLGKTGLSCIRHLKRMGIPFVVMDNREAPPELDHLQVEFPEVQPILGCWDTALLTQAEEVIVSPGLSLFNNTLSHLLRRQSIIGDIELFARVIKVPVFAVTGSNGKSTVTTLLGEMAKQAGLSVQVGGNLGIPALDLWESNPTAACFILELSSFQLETTHSLRPQAATILNITPDHMDRYADFDAYKAAKHKIYTKSQIAIVNRQDLHTIPSHHPKILSFGLDVPDKNMFGLRYLHSQTWLCKSEAHWMPISELKLRGNHNVANALAALAMGSAMGLAPDVMIAVLKTFTGLPHRCQLILRHRDIDWINDSKGTNVGATQAALEGFTDTLQGKIILIAGGDGKSAPFTPLREVIQKQVRALILLGKDARRMAAELKDAAPIFLVKTLEEAVVQAKTIAIPWDIVLLSPACASLDMFQNYEHRGSVFAEAVMRQVKSP